MTAKDQPDGQNGEIPADVPIPLPKNWLLRSGILPAPEVLPLRNWPFSSFARHRFWCPPSSWQLPFFHSGISCLIMEISIHWHPMLIWMLSTFFFTLSGIRHGTGRGLTYFVLVYVLSYLFSLAAAAIPADVQLLTGIRGGILVFGSLYPSYFPFCVVGIITCILRKILK